ncbi:MAG: hypothetical protein BWK73_07070 [Thiothrix lacustris]|uniref:Uncharacterized protein n=1 Tax=Thiothrix lacustris TaxID=525917 RepID=A0A1Y1QW67_9GAMM|nr:MAG: hypothetical protein BWK73_07070 [Thiothrix lacustris]
MNQPNPAPLFTDFPLHLSTKLSTEWALINSLPVAIKTPGDAAVKACKWMTAGVIGRLNKAFYRVKLFFNPQFSIRVEKAAQAVASTSLPPLHGVTGLIHKPCQPVTNQCAMFHVELVP